MTQDFIDKEFADLDVYYPGSKRKRREKPVIEKKIKADWDANPTLRTLPNGKDVEFFQIGSLALALGRPLITLRAWMKEGYLPASPYRLPSKIDKNGKELQGRRLYTRPMIEAAVEAFTRAGLLDSKRVEWSLHRQLIREIDEAWSNIRAQETETNETIGE